MFVIKHHVIKQIEKASVALHFLNFDTRCRKVLSFTVQQLSSPWYPLERGWVGPKTDLKIWEKRIPFLELMVQAY